MNNIYSRELEKCVVLKKFMVKRTNKFTNLTLETIQKTFKQPKKKVDNINGYLEWKSRSLASLLVSHG